MNIIQLTKKLETLEQKKAPTNSHVCFVRPDEDRDDVLAKFRLDNNVQGGIIHVVKFKHRDNRP